MGENQLERSLFFTQVTSWEVAFWEHTSELLPHPWPPQAEGHVCQIALEKAGQRRGAVSGRLKMKHLVLQASLKWKS